MTSNLSLSKKNSTTESNHQILCFHVNATSRIQIIRLSNISQYAFERVVFPGERLIFEATPQANLEIYSSEQNFSTVPCWQLRITDFFPIV